MNRANSLLIVLCFSICCFSAEVYAQTWVHDSFDDFSKGTLDASGQNIYLNKKGEIRSIRRFDLNGDSFIDLLFNSTHDDDVAVPATITTSANGQLVTRPLPMEGSVAAGIADLNKDGYSDMVFCPNNQYGAQTPRRFVTIVYGGEDGWPVKRSNGLLPLNGGKGIAIADMDSDSWPDIITLNSKAWLPGQPEGNIARIYWGSENGFLLTKFQDVGVGDAIKIVAGDFDSDNASDVAFLTGSNSINFLWGQADARDPIKTASKQKGSDKPEHTQTKLNLELIEVKLPGKRAVTIEAADIDKDGRMDVLIGSNNHSIYILKGKGERSWNTPVIVSNINATSLAAGDLDKDGHTDLVATYFSLHNSADSETGRNKNSEDNSIKILWGDSDNFSSSRMSVLAASYAKASAIADLDGNGHMDIVCATYHGEKTYAAESVIFYGTGSRNFKRSEKGIPGNGANHIAVVPSKEGKTAAIVISNSIGGSLNEELPLMLYYGSSNGFNEENLLKIPFNSGYEASAADLNEDGYVDLLAINAMHAGQANNPYRGVNIFWGSKTGYDIENRRTVLNENNASTSNVADLNRDGYLDIVVGFFDHSDGSPTEVVIYYGSEQGFEQKNRVAILAEGRSSSPTIADYNKDGWLDIVVNSYSKDLLRVFWGSSDGFKEKNQQIITLPSVIDIETADLNNDGYLDLIASSYKDKVNSYHDTGVMLFWGSSEGFREWNAQWLPSSTVLGPVAADFDNDGYLDLFLPSYHSEISREALPMYLYWGASGGYSIKRRTVFILDSGADALAADFDKDGMIDLAVASHATDGTHSKAVSKVYYNDGMRFQSASIKTEYLPSTGSHWMWNYDLGHIYTRKHEQTFISSVMNLDKDIKNGKISYEAIMPFNTDLNFAVRSAATMESLSGAEWRSIETSGFPVDNTDRHLQYKVTLKSDNGDRYPVLKKVHVTLK